MRLGEPRANQLLSSDLFNPVCNRNCIEMQVVAANQAPARWNSEINLKSRVLDIAQSPNDPTVGRFKEGVCDCIVLGGGFD